MKPRRDDGASVDVFESNDVHRFAHEAMATVFEVHVAHDDSAYAGQAAQAAFALLDRLEQELSRFVANSDVSRINALGAGRQTRVGSSTMDCLVIARHVHALTGGAFDVSIGTGLDRLELQPDDLAVQASADGIRIDLGGIGKGYAVDRMAAVLEEWGLERALVHGGFSSVLALEAPPGRTGWPLALRVPAPPAASSGPPFARIEARQLALSASGTRKGGHIVDPRTGRSVESGAAWAALPRSRGEGHAPAAVADALTTAFMLMKRRQIEALCRANPELDAWLVARGRRRAVAHIGARAAHNGGSSGSGAGTPGSEDRNSMKRTSSAYSVLLLAAALAAHAVGVGAADSKLVPLPIQLPKPMFEGTPQNLKVPNLQKPLGRPRDPFLAPAGVTNVAKGKTVAASDMEPIIGEIAQVNDGDKKGADGSYVELGPGLQHVTIDLGAPHEVFAVLFWHFHKQPRAYLDVVVQLADDVEFTKNVRTIFNNDHDNTAGLGAGKDMNYVETSEGRLVDAKGGKARCVRLYTRGNNANELNHYVEVEVFGRPAR